MSMTIRINSLIPIVLCLSVAHCVVVVDSNLNVLTARDRGHAVGSGLSRGVGNTGAVPITQSARIQGAQAQKTVDQTRKNIQVLKGLPDQQLVNVMNFVATSLGVQCNFCHVQQGKDPQTGFTNWIWESDEKPEKQTARRMMQMVLSVKTNNKTDFKNDEITCFTCHRGQRLPISLPSLPLARSGHEPGPDDSTKSSSTTLPSIEQIFVKYIQALGADVATNTKTLVLKGTRLASQDRKWPNEITLALPDKVVIVATTPQGTVRQIVNGQEGWVINGANVRSLSPTEIVEAKRSWDELFNVIKVKQLEGMKIRGLEKVGDRETFVVENATDPRTERFYFDSQTGLLLRKITINKTILMPFPDQIDFEDYRDVDGVKVPFTIRFSGIDTFNSWTRTFTEIKRNPVLDETIFAAPRGGSN